MHPFPARVAGERILPFVVNSAALYAGCPEWDIQTPG
jgi:hypothetical protein